MPPKKKKKACPFSHTTPRREDDKILLQRVSFEISREREGLILQSRKMAKRWQSSWKTIETTAESSLTSFLASGTSFFGREAVRRAMKSREVPRHIKIGRRTVLKVYCSGREASKLQEVQGPEEFRVNKWMTYLKSHLEKCLYRSLSTIN